MIHLAAEHAAPALAAELVHAIVQSFVRNAMPGEYRAIDESLEFYESYSAWRWYDDTDGGLYLAGSLDESPCLLGIRRGTEPTAEGEGGESPEVLPPFEAGFTINNTFVPAVGSGRTDELAYLILEYKLELQGQPYQVRLVVAEEDLTVPPISLHEHDTVRDAFRYQLFFPLHNYIPGGSAVGTGRRRTRLSCSQRDDRGNYPAHLSPHGAVPARRCSPSI